MSSRKLSLRHEALADLTSDELHSVAGASGKVCGDTLVPTRCGCTGYYPSLNAPCTETIDISGSVCG